MPWNWRIGIPQIIRDIFANIATVITNIATVITDVGTVNTNVGTAITNVGAIQTTADNIETKVDTAITDVAAVQVTADAGLAATNLHGQHFHSWERWLGAAASPSGETHVADTDSMTAFAPDGGNDTWGSWLQIIGSADTPITAAMVQYDMHRILITAVERANALYRMQFAFGASGAAALSAGTYTDAVYKAPSAAAQEWPVEIRLPKQAVTTKAWVRVWAAGQNTATMSLFIGVHEYDA